MTAHTPTSSQPHDRTGNQKVRQRPTFAVIITTYNRAHLVSRVISAVLAQEYRDFEVIVVDDGSTDATANVVDALREPRLRYVHQSNQGPSAARNAGASAAFGDYLIFVDDDDEPLPSWLMHLARLIAESSADLVFCGATYFTQEGELIKTIVPDPKGPKYAGRNVLFRAGTFAVRREFFKAVGGYSETLPRSTHTELGIRLTEFCRQKGAPMASVNQPLIHMHRHRRSSTYPADRLSAAKYILANHSELMRQHPKVMATYLSIAGVNAARTGDFAQARRSFFQAIRHRPAGLKNYFRLVISLIPPLANILWYKRNLTK